jgi:phage gpG-like protein
MQITISIQDTMTPSLARAIAAARDLAPVMNEVGRQIVSLTQQAFTDATIRPATWPDLAASTIKSRKRYNPGAMNPLLRSGNLRSSIRVIAADASSVTMGSALFSGRWSIAAIHQMGAPKRNIPPRPFFPFTDDGRPTDRADKLIRETIDDKLDAAFKG